MSPSTVFTFLLVGLACATAAAWLLMRLANRRYAALCGLGLFAAWLAIAWLIDPSLANARLPGQVIAIGASVFTVLSFPMYFLQRVLKEVNVQRKSSKE